LAEGRLLVFAELLNALGDAAAVVHGIAVRVLVAKVGWGWGGLVVEGVAASKGHGAGRRDLLSGYAHFPLDTSEMRVSAYGLMTLYVAG
jgi:hypothetical protein